MPGCRSKPQLETPAVYIAILILLSFAIYWRTLSFGFVYDDYHQDRYYSLKEIISTFYGTWDPRYIEANFYRPLVVVSYALNYFIFKTDPFGYHLTNIFLNMVNVILVYFIMRKISANFIFSFIAAILFLLIPYNWVSVTWISHRSDSIVTLFYLSSFLAFVTSYNSQRKIFYYLSTLCFIFSLMSKEMAVTLPFVLLSYSYLQSKRLEMKLIMPYLVILCSYMLFRFLIFKGMGGYGTTYPLYEAMLMNWSLAFLRTFTPFSYTDFYYLLIYLVLIFILICFSVVHFKSFENKNNIFFAFSWVGITILPLYTVSLFRLLYLPSIGFAILLSLICLEIHKKNFKYSVIFIIGLCLMLAHVNIKYQDVFSPASDIVLDRDKDTYFWQYNKLDKEQATILEQKLERYGLLSEAKDLMKPREKIDEFHIEETTVPAHVKKIYKEGGLKRLFQRILSLPTEVF